MTRYMRHMKRATARPLGRPSGTAEHEHLVHVRLSQALKDELDTIRAQRLDGPNVSALIREALAMLIENERRRRKTKD